MGRNYKIHPTHAMPREVLPESYSRSCTGFLLCISVMVEVDQDTIKKDSEYLQKHAIVAKFVGGRHLGRGFFQIMLPTSNHSKGSHIDIAQVPVGDLLSWTPGFNAAYPTSLRVPTWITLKNIPLSSSSWGWLPRWPQFKRITREQQM
uniref:Uncharacterized protein n=1 Tax=Physcomitrium patens TaxID=3218 RepID=A9TT10_PHYPA|nr:hypothetical protein PHYPA_008503 [Physcomitrium patens]